MLFVWRLSQTLYLLVDICFKYWRFSSRDDEYCNAWELSGFGNHKLLIEFQWWDLWWQIESGLGQTRHRKRTRRIEILTVKWRVDWPLALGSPPATLSFSPVVPTSCKNISWKTGKNVHWKLGITNRVELNWIIFGLNFLVPSSWLDLVIKCRI